MRRPASLLVAALCAAPAAARAESMLVGAWRQGPLREEWKVQNWIPACGPAPTSGSLGGGEAIAITESGDELVLAGGGRTFQTNQCYEPMPTLARDAHSVDPSGKMWRTKCATPPADPRRAVVNTLVVATGPGRIEITETGRYEIKLAEGTCMADVKRSRVLEVVPAATKPAASAPEPPAPSAAPAPGPAKPCAVPGEPARLEVRPSRKLLRTGETFVFRAIVRDAEGCVAPTPTTWAVAQTAGARRATVDPSGRVTVPADAPEGRVEIVATAAGRSVRVEVAVASPANYDALLAASGLDARGENDAPSVAQLEGASIGVVEARAEDAASERKTRFALFAGALTTILGVVALVFRRRAARAAALEARALAQHEDELRAAEGRRQRMAAEHAAQQRAHDESVQRAQLAVERAQAARAAATRRPPEATAPDKVCPSCGKDFAGETAFCPHDGAKLAPRGARPAGAVAATMGSSSSMPLPARGKICPTCGGRFDGNAAYCGKDGTALVLLN